MNLSEEQLAALAAGASYEEVLAMDVASAVDTTPVDPAATAEGSDEDTGAEASETEEEQLDAEALNVQLQEVQEKLTASASEVKTLQAQLASAKAEAEKTQAQLATSLNNMAAALRPYVERMATALNQAVDASDADKVLEAHSRLQPLFAKSFKAGRQSVSTSSATSSTKLSEHDSKMLARARSFNL